MGRAVDLIRHEPVYADVFRYVFGGTIVIPGIEYVNYLMPGIFGQTVVFGGTATAIGLVPSSRSKP